MLVVAAIVATLALRDRHGGAPGPQLDPDRPGPVLLVAGYGGSASSLEGLATSLRRDGRSVIVVPPVGDNTGDLLEQARSLDLLARREIAAGAPSVDVVGYSAGGVVARLWVADLDGDALARRVVTLGSPHHGTRIAGLGLLVGSCPTACQQLSRDSDLLGDLPQSPRGPSWVSIWTADDDVVLPPTSARMDGAVDVEVQHVCPDSRVTHGELPTDPLTRGLVRLALDGPPLEQAPSAGLCGQLRASG